MAKAAAPAAAPALSAERRVLAEAIEAARGDAARDDATVAAYQTAAADVFRLYQAEEVAEAAVAEAQAGYADVLVKQALGKFVEAPLTPREARARLASVKDELVAAVETRNALQQQAEANAARQWIPATRVKEAAFAVIKAEARSHTMELVDEVERTQARLLRLITALEWLTGTAAVLPTVEEHGSRYGKVLDPRASTIIVHMGNRPDQWFHLLDRPECRADRAWSAALDALMADPNAPLPLQD